MTFHPSDPNKLIFLDVDGVLNDHRVNPVSLSGYIKPACMKRLNRIIRRTHARIVISSAWRYMIHGGSMNIDGFSYMLRTHGLSCDALIVGITCSDEQVQTRPEQIALYLEPYPSANYVVLDDLSPLNRDWSILKNVILTDGTQGLTDTDAKKAIHLLNGVPNADDKR